MKKLRIAVQKSGRLHEDSLKLLKDAGIQVDNGRQQLKAASKNFPLEIFYLRNSDIPQYLLDGVVDTAIIGENELIEKGGEIRIEEKLGFSKCRLSLAVPQGATYSGIESLDGKKIATSFPNTVRNYFREKGYSAEIHVINGSVEIAPNIGLADGIADLVSSGSTLFQNNLKEAEIILESQAVLAVSPTISNERAEVLDKLRFRIQAVLRARSYKYILMNIPNDKLDSIIELLPGMKSPTVLPLAIEGWSSIHTVIQEEQFWNVIDELKNRGAEGILVCPIEKMIL